MFLLSGLFCCVVFPGVFLVLLFGRGLVLLFAVCGVAGPAQTAKKKHAPDPSERFLFLLLGQVVVFVFCCLGGGRVFVFVGRGSCFCFLCLGGCLFFGCCLGGDFFFLFCCLGGVHVCVCVCACVFFLLLGVGGLGGGVRGEACFCFFLFGRGTGVGLPGSSLNDPTTTKRPNSKNKNTGSVFGSKSLKT